MWTFIYFRFNAWPVEALLSVSRRVLASQELGSERLNAAVADMCAHVHASVEEQASAFFLELKRRYYVTPKSYLDLLQLYIKLLGDKRQDMALARERLLDGLQKLQDTNVVVDTMQAELNALKPVLTAKTGDTERLLVQVEAERKEAEGIRETVITEEQEVSHGASASLGTFESANN